jgi:adenylate kinase family enzyme
LFYRNKDYDRPYTEFGGWNGTSHNGFLPTGQTAIFLLTQLNENPLAIPYLFGKDHWFYKNNILHIEGQGEGEPFLSGRLVVSDEVLAKMQGQKYEPEYNAGFPAKRIIIPLEWEDLVLPYNLLEELDDIICWIKNQTEIRKKWQLDKIVRQGYRCLFYGPPGTGKTLTATLLGKQNEMDVYRIDLSMIVSKYIGETEKNLAKVFDKAEHQNWILFFDEADALFGQRTETQSSNDRHANQEVAYLLQRIEDFPGIVILATNLKENIDEAFFRRFQSTLYFPMPDERLRYRLWKNMLPPAWLDKNGEELIQKASTFNLSGGSMVNVIQTCAVKLYGRSETILTLELLKDAIRKELTKEGKIIDN